MLKFSVQGGIATLHSRTMVPTECRMVAEVLAKPRTNEPTAGTGIKEDEEKTAFHTSQGVYRYTKMIFGLKNARVTYQRLVDKAFKKQFGRNLKLYVDDLVIKSHTEQEILRDIKETFQTLRKINIKLNPKKCTFGVEEGTFLGYVVSMKGIQACSKKAEAVIKLQSPRTLKEVQSLNEKLASLNRFLSKSTEKSLPFFKTLKNCIKKSAFQWKVEAKKAFQEMKQCIAELPMLTAPKPKEELIMYLCATREVPRAASSESKLQLNGKVDIGPGTRLKKAEKVLADFIAERQDKDGPPTRIQVEENIPEPWTFFTNGSSCLEESGARLILTNPVGMEFAYALRFKFNTSNNKTKYEALVAGLRIAEQMGWPFYKWGIDISGPFPEAQGKVKFLIVAIDYFTKWIEAKQVATITENQNKKLVWDSIVCRFGLPGEIMSDNVKQFRDNPFKEWCDKLNIKQRFASIKPPQTNRHVERANRGLGEGIKARLDEGNKNWIEEVSHVLWAMIKTTNGHTPFSFTYGMKSVIPVEIGMPSLRCAKVNQAMNDEALLLNLDVLEEEREKAAIRVAKSKAKMEKYYNDKVRSTTFKPRDIVYRNNEASHAKVGGKLGPKWEGPYEVVEALGRGAYKIKNRKRRHTSTNMEC
ncbi:reverse transcriptase domain-containing protein [Tanacetum coccineum]